MSVCATCLESGIRDGQHDCPGLGDIAVTRQLGYGLIVTDAPRRARLDLALLAEHGYGLTMASNDQINIADQVLYQVVGYDTETASLLLELVEDWRPTPTVVLPEDDVDDIKTRWREAYGKPGTAHVVTELHTADRQPVPGFRPFTPAHIPKTGDPADALVVEPYRADDGSRKWVFRCWGTDTCDGWLSLDHTSQQSAERTRYRHVAEHHPEEQHTVADTPACTATIEGPHTGSSKPVPCALPAHGDDQQHESAPEGPTHRRLHWTDHHAGATPHGADRGERR